MSRKDVEVVEKAIRHIKALAVLLEEWLHVQPLEDPKITQVRG